MMNNSQENNNSFNRAMTAASDNFTITAAVNAALYEHIFTFVVSKISALFTVQQSTAKAA